MLTPLRAAQRAAHELFQQVQPQRIVVFVSRVTHLGASFHVGTHITDRKEPAQYFFT